MKKSMFTVLCLAFIFTAISQDRDMPPPYVRESFQKVYPQSQPSRWSHDNGGWSVVFEDRDNDNGEVTAHFDSRGRHIDTHVYYAGNDVPAPVADHFHHRYDGADNYQYTHIERRRGGDFYQVHFRHRAKYRTIYVDDMGNERQYRDRH